MSSASLISLFSRPISFPPDKIAVILGEDRIPDFWYMLFLHQPTHWKEETFWTRFLRCRDSSCPLFPYSDYKSQREKRRLESQSSYYSYLPPTSAQSPMYVYPMLRTQPPWCEALQFFLQLRCFLQARQIKRNHAIDVAIARNVVTVGQRLQRKVVCLRFIWENRHIAPPELKLCTENPLLQNRFYLSKLV